MLQQSSLDVFFPILLLLPYWNTTNKSRYDSFRTLVSKQHNEDRGTRRSVREEMDKLSMKTPEFSWTTYPTQVRDTLSRKTICQILSANRVFVEEWQEESHCWKKANKRLLLKSQERECMEEVTCVTGDQRFTFWSQNVWVRASPLSRVPNRKLQINGVNEIKWRSFLDGLQKNRKKK